jgi:hypothetical protein
MGPFADGLTARLRSRPYLHVDEGRRAVSLPPRARVTRVAPWAAHHLVRYVTARARFVPLSPGRRPAASGRGATHQDDAVLDAFMEGERDGDDEDVLLRLGRCPPGPHTCRRPSVLRRPDLEHPSD